MTGDKIFPILDRPTPILDVLRSEKREPGKLLNKYSWAATWVSLALAVSAIAATR